MPSKSKAERNFALVFLRLFEGVRINLKIKRLYSKHLKG